MNIASEEPPPCVFALARPPGRRRFIAVAPNGGRRTTADHPAVPTTPETLADTALSCVRAGAAMIHLHVRDSAQRHLLDVDAYRTAIAAVRKAVGDELVIQITTEALGLYSPAAQRQIVRDVRPEAASLAFRELAVDAAGEGDFADLLRWMDGEGIAAQIILYNVDDLDRLEDFAGREGFDLSRLSLLYVLGRYVERPDGLRQLVQFASSPRPAVRDIMVCTFGREEVGLVAAAALFGANARVGFENNLLLPNGRTARDNADSVHHTRSALESVGLTIGTATELREQWHQSAQ